MRIPSNPDNPTFDEVFTVSAWKWLTAAGSLRNEWRRRRNQAAKTAAANQRARAAAKGWK